MISAPLIARYHLAQHVGVSDLSAPVLGIRISASVTTLSPAAARTNAALRERVDAALRAAYASFAAGSSAGATPTFAVELRPHAHARDAMIRVGAGMAGVGSVIAVASGKGGVGKSTVAVNLAFALAAAGARVGILDADIHGPSLPIMVTPEEPGGAVAGVVKRADGFIVPLSMAGVRLMSYGFVAPRNARGERGGAVLRGALVTQVVQQLCRFTDWGSLDHLVVDMPPGTGDVHITLGQTLPITTAVIVTTPQGLALADVRKGLDMFKALRVPSAAAVLNMAHFDAPDTGRRYFPFGSGGEPLAALAREHGIPSIFTLPIDSHLSESGDSGVPAVLADPNGSVAGVYADLAERVAEAAEAQMWRTDSALPAGPTPAGAGQGGGDSANAPPALHAKLDERRGVLVLREFGPAGAREWELPSRAVRLACRCAACVDEVSGAHRLRPGAVPEDVRPLRVSPQGNYGLRIEWSDGHGTGIYTLDQLRGLADGGTAT